MAKQDISQEQEAQILQARPDVGANKYYAKNVEEWWNKYGIKEMPDFFNPKQAYAAPTVAAAATGTPNPAPDDLMGIRDQIQTEMKIPDLTTKYGDLFKQLNEFDTATEKQTADIMNQPLVMNKLRGIEAQTQEQRDISRSGIAREAQVALANLQAAQEEANNRYNIRASEWEAKRPYLMEYPDAGILPSDSWTTVASKVAGSVKKKNTQSYLLELASAHPQAKIDVEKDDISSGLAKVAKDIDNQIEKNNKQKNLELYASIFGYIPKKWGSKQKKELKDYFAQQVAYTEQGWKLDLDAKNANIADIYSQIASRDTESGRSDFSTQISAAKTLSDMGYPDAAASLSEGALSGFSSGGPAQGYRTDRNNNPIAAAVSAGGKNQFTNALDKARIKWTYGDSFPDNPKMKTIKIQGNAVEGARAILSGSNAIQGWYIKSTGKSVLAKYGVTNNEQFRKASKEVQNKIIEGIYKAEVGNGSLMKSSAGTSKASRSNPNVIPKPRLSDAPGKTMNEKTANWKKLVKKWKNGEDWRVKNLFSNYQPKKSADEVKKQLRSDTKKTVNKFFDGVKGRDGFVNPKDWNKALRWWKDKGLSATDFTDYFEQYVNEDDISVKYKKK